MCDPGVALVTVGERMGSGPCSILHSSLLKGSTRNGKTARFQRYNSRIQLSRIAGHGPVTNQCVVQHANGSAQTNNLVVPDWFDPSLAAFIANGDLNLNTRMTDSVGANYPKLYSVDLPLANTASPVTNVLLSFKSGPSNSHSAIFAMSGLPVQSSGVRPTLSISRLPGGNLRIGTSQAGLLQSTTALNGTNTLWQTEGIISSTLDVSPTPAVSVKFYRVIAQ